MRALPLRGWPGGRADFRVATLSEHAHEEAAAEPAAATPTLAPAANGRSTRRSAPIRPRACSASSARSATRRPGGCCSATPRASGRRPSRCPPGGRQRRHREAPSRTSAVRPDQRRRHAASASGPDAIRSAKWAIDHIVVIAGVVYAASADGRPAGNFTRKGSFGLRPGVYVIDGVGTAQFGYRGGKLSASASAGATRTCPRTSASSSTSARRRSRSRARRARRSS